MKILPSKSVAASGELRAGTLAEAQCPSAPPRYRRTPCKYHHWDERRKYVRICTRCGLEELKP